MKGTGRLESTQFFEKKVTFLEKTPLKSVGHNYNKYEYWYDGEKYVRLKTKECIICGHKNNVFNDAPVSPLISMPVNPKIMWRVHVDLPGKVPVTKNGSKYIVVAICVFDKYIEAKGNCPIYF